MPKEFERPEDKIILDDREAAGLWKAIALAKELGEGGREINLAVILEIHDRIFKDVMPEIAGRFRKKGEDVKKLACVEPPLGTAVAEAVHVFEKDLAYKLSRVGTNPGSDHKKRYKAWVKDVFELAAWTQHKLVAIHPFCEGNGRIARLMTNVVLRRFGIPTTDVKIESEHKAGYLNALCQIDKHGNYEPLRELLFRGAIETLKKERERRLKKQAAL